MDVLNGSRTGAPLARLRQQAGATQATVAAKAGLDQSRVSRIEKGEVVALDEIDRVLCALSELGVEDAEKFRSYLVHDWLHVEPPSFWNPQRTCLEIADEMLGEIETFLSDDERPWPLRRQVERHRDSLSRTAAFLSRVDHNIAFIGDIGVGKSTAISFVFDLLVPSSLADKQINRPILETGAGGTTICEVHVKGGPEFGISLLPMGDGELRELVSDFCASKWMTLGSDKNESGESVGVSREAERAIRNMAGMTRRRETVAGKLFYLDPVVDMARGCSSEEEFRTRILGLMSLPDRSKRELWYDSATRKNPMEWVTETFKSVNNGRLKDVSLPRSIDLIIPNFGKDFGELELSIIDTKGVDDVAVREDIDFRLRDPRTSVVFCSRFNDAPGTSTRILLQHMRQTFSERVDTGKVSVLALPRSGEARAMKDDVGEHALADSEGYEFKRMQVALELDTDHLSGVPMIFFNVEADEPGLVRADLFNQITRLRKSVEERLFDLCAAAQDVIANHEAKALNAALEEVANRLNTFLKGNWGLGARERLAHAEAISTIKAVRYASTLWATTRRSGEYSGLNIVHLTSVGAARDAKLRSDSWFKGLNAFLNSLKADDDLAIASRTIDQISATAASSRAIFLEGVQRGATEVYREPVTQMAPWAQCVSEWGQGAGFKMRVAAHLEKWFGDRADLKKTLEELVTSLWEQNIVAPLLRLAEEAAPEANHATLNVMTFPQALSA